MRHGNGGRQADSDKSGVVMCIARHRGHVQPEPDTGSQEIRTCRRGQHSCSGNGSVDDRTRGDERMISGRKKYEYESSESGRITAGSTALTAEDEDCSEDRVSGVSGPSDSSSEVSSAPSQSPQGRSSNRLGVLGLDDGVGGGVLQLQVDKAETGSGDSELAVDVEDDGDAGKSGRDNAISAVGDVTRAGGAGADSADEYDTGPGKCWCCGVGPSSSVSSTTSKSSSSSSSSRRASSQAASSATPSGGVSEAASGNSKMSASGNTKTSCSAAGDEYSNSGAAAAACWSAARGAEDIVGDDDDEATTRFLRRTQR